VTLPAFAAKRRTAGACCGTHSARAAVDRYLLPAGAQQQTRRTPLLMLTGGTDRQTDERTDARPLHKPCSAYYAGSVKKNKINIDMRK